MSKCYKVQISKTAATTLQQKRDPSARTGQEVYIFKFKMSESQKKALFLNLLGQQTFAR